MPLDQSIVFDGGWRILSGQVPYRDFTTPTGLVPIVFQALFFHLFGTTWFAYCLHAAVFNGAFCIVVYFLLRSMEGTKAVSFFYALLSGVVMYPPMGVPYMDQHSFFFLLLTILTVLLARQSVQEQQRILLWCLVPPIFLLSFFSKQNPAVFGAPLILGFALLEYKAGRFRETAAALIGSSVFCACFIGVLILSYRVDLDLVQLYFFELPSQTGMSRLDVYAKDPLDSLKDMFSGFHSLYSYLIMLIGTSVVLWLAGAYYFSKPQFIFKRIMLFLFKLLPGALLMLLSVFLDNHRYPFLIVGLVFMTAGLSVQTSRLARSGNWLVTRAISTGVLLPSFLAVALIAICCMFAFLTCNSPLNGIAYIFASVGLIHISAGRLLDGIDRAKLRRALSFAILGGFVIVASVDAYSFNQSVNSARLVSDCEHISYSGQDTHQDLPDNLSFMVFAVPDFYDFTASDLRSLMHFIKESNSNFLLLSDASILYGLTGRPSISPSLFFDYDQAIPLSYSPAAFERYQDRLVDSMKKHDVRFIITQGAETWQKAKLSDFNRLARIETDLAASFGDFNVYRITGTL